MEAIKVFAELFRVGTKQDSCGELIIPGSLRATGLSERLEDTSHVYDHGDGRRFGVLLMFQSKKSWHFAKKKLLTAGFTISQDGDTEGIALFDPHNREQAKLALGLAQVKARRILSREQKQARADRMRYARRFKRPNVERGLEAVFQSQQRGEGNSPSRAAGPDFEGVTWHIGDGTRNEVFSPHFSQGLICTHIPDSPIGIVA